VGNQPNIFIENISIDSRSLQNGRRRCFLPSLPNNDAHTYVAELVAKGVRNFVVTHPIAEFEEQANFLGQRYAGEPTTFCGLA
jgi:alanine racemase